METKLIKTCHGLKEIRFHDGAVLPAGIRMVDILEARKREAEQSITARMDQILWVELPQRQVSELSSLNWQRFWNRIGRLRQ